MVACFSCWLQKDVLWDISPSLAFFLMGVVSLAVFMLWRTLRACCLCWCCKASCADQRQQNDPRVILKGWGMWLIKGCMLVLAIAAIGLAVYGMTKTKEDVGVGSAVRAWKNMICCLLCDREGWVQLQCERAPNVQSTVHALGAQKYLLVAQLHTLYKQCMHQPWPQQAAALGAGSCISPFWWPPTCV